MIFSKLNILLFLLVAFILVNLSFFEAKSIVKKRALVGPIWPTNKIAYAFTDNVEFDFNSRKQIEHILKQTEILLSVNGESCIEFIPRHDETDYILFVDKGDCSSSIGYHKGINTISLSKECITYGKLYYNYYYYY
jgi:hypothetical protein